MEEWFAHFLASQIMNVLTILAFYAFDNPIRNALIVSDYPRLITVFLLYLCAPVVLFYLCMYSVTMFTVSLFACCHYFSIMCAEYWQCLVEKGKSCNNFVWDRPTASPVPDPHLYQNDNISVVSAPPSYTSRAPSVAPSRARYQPPQSPAPEYQPPTVDLPLTVDLPPLYTPPLYTPPAPLQPPPALDRIAALRGALGTIATIPPQPLPPSNRNRIIRQPRQPRQPLRPVTESRLPTYTEANLESTMEQNIP